jgi:hypothetical protein
MSDETNEVIEQTETTETVSEPQAQAEAIETDWKSEARKWEARAKAAKADSEAATKWREYEKSLKPEQERLAEELAQIKAEASEATVKLMRYEVASQKGIPSDAIDLLTGSSREELESSADKLLSLIANQSKPQIKPDINQGKVSANGSSTADQFATALGQLL